MSDLRTELMFSDEGRSITIQRQKDANRIRDLIFAYMGDISKVVFLDDIYPTDKITVHEWLEIQKFNKLSK